VELLVAFGTDDGINLKSNEHFGMSRYFYVYRFSSEGEELIEQRKNVDFKGDESLKHGDPEKAKATASVLKGVDVCVGARFGPNLPRLLKQFVCVVARTDTIEKAIKLIRGNMDLVLGEKEKGEGRKHLVLRC